MGAVVEAGIALAFKPNNRIVLITQDSLRDLHFDMKGLYFDQYTIDNLVERVAHALFKAASRFEEEIRLYITSVSASLTSDSILLLNRYGIL